MDDKTTMTKQRVFFTLCIWFIIIGIMVGLYRYVWVPHRQSEMEATAKKEQRQIVEKTSSHARYQNSVNFAADAFSGYAPIRTATFRDELGKYGCRLDLRDDKANYPDRFEKLASGTLDMGTFTVDALQKCASLYKAKHPDVEVPVTIVDIIDETKGADAMVASKTLFPNIDSLNYADLKICCTADSPSETLARVVMAYFSLDKLSDNPFMFFDSVDAVYAHYQKTKPTERKVFVLWEPYVTKVLDNPEYHDLVNSSKFRGYITDVIVARRGFLVQQEPLAVNVVKSYRTALFQNRNSMVALVADDARQMGTPLKSDQAEHLVETIWWKNTQESFGHFGLTSGHGLQHIDDICRSTLDVLLKTKAITADPSGGQTNLWYYDGIMRQLFDTSWHPGFGNESVRQEKALAELSDTEWKSLRAVGTLKVPRLVFARGTARLSEGSYQTLDTLCENMRSWPQYYLTVQGNAGGTTEADKFLAEARANVAVDYLINKGVARARIRGEHATSGSTTVAFILGELPY